MSKAITNLFYWTIGTAFMLAGVVCLSAGNPKTTIAGPTTTATEGSIVTNITFQSIATKGGWIVTPATLAGWIAMTIRARRREEKVDILIKSIEAAGSDSVKAVLRHRADPWIDHRVACLSKKHGWGQH